jgi:hypothetical protein
VFSWQWENFKEIIQTYAPTVDDHGPLAGPIRRFTIWRDAHLRLWMETEASESATEPQSHHPPGTVRINDDRVTFRTSMGLELEAIGASPTHLNRHFEGTAPGITTQKVKINRLVGKFSQSERPRYTIDWLENVPTEFSWPDNITNTSFVTFTVILGGILPTRPKLVINGSSSSGGGSWAAAQLEVEGSRLYLCQSQGLSGIDAKKPGFIVYDGVPTDEFRDRIRRCLSFSLGTYLVNLGVSRFDEEWNLTDFEVVSPYSMRGCAIALPPTPPSPLGPRSFWDIDAVKLSRMVNAIYAKYDALNFGVVSWAYWHAVTATPHIAAVHFGAALESLQRAYFSSTAAPASSKVVDDQTWDKIRISLESALDNSDLPGETRETFKNKIKNLNNRSQHSTDKDLVDELGLVLSNREKQAHDARHLAAHGKDDEMDVEWIRDLKLLRVRFHRVFLAMTGANHEYYDYFTVGNPIRRVEESVPDS